MTALTLTAGGRQRMLRALRQPAQSQTRGGVGQLVCCLGVGRRGTGLVRVPVM